MSLYPWLRFLHVLGVVLLASGLLGGLVAQIRMRRCAAVAPMVDALRYQETFGNFLVFPGAVVAGASGLWMALEAGLGLFDIPWLTTMWMLFVFEFIEGNTITRLHGSRLQRSLEVVAPDVREVSRLPEEVHRLLAGRLPALSTGLDIGLGLLMIALGMLRPNDWQVVGLALLCALAMAVTLAASLLRIQPTEATGNDTPRTTSCAHA